jgi:hypothetical protein
LVGGGARRLPRLSEVHVECGHGDVGQQREDPLGRGPRLAATEDRIVGHATRPACRDQLRH